MKILMIGKNKVISNNLISLGADVTVLKHIPCKSTEYDGIVITKELPFYSMDALRSFKIPIIVLGHTQYPYHNIDVLVFNEKETDKFLSELLDKPKGLDACKDILRNLKIKYLVVTFGKEKIEKYIKQNLPVVKATEVKVTKETVDKAKDVVTAIVTYIYIKTKGLSIHSIKQANIKAAVAAKGTKNLENVTDYYLKIKSKKE